MTEEHIASCYHHDSGVQARMVARDCGSGLSSIAAEHFKVSLPRTFGFPPIVDPMTKLENQVAEYERQVQEYEALADLYQRLNEDLARERDILAKRCAAQAHEIAELLSPPIRDVPDPVFAAIAVHQKQGVR